MAKKSKKQTNQKPNLSKMKKKDILEIMLEQSREIDALRKENVELRERLDERIFDLEEVGSIAEASLAVTNIFKEAEKAAAVYLENVRAHYE